MLPPLQPPAANSYDNNEAAVGVVSVPVPSDFRDLSLNHCSLGALSTESLSDPRVLSKYQLSVKQVDKFWRDGYLSNVRVLSEEQCEKILAEYEPFMVSGTHAYSLYSMITIHSLVIHFQFVPRTLASYTLDTDCSMSSIATRVGHLTMSSCMPSASGGSLQPSMTFAFYPLLQ